MNIRELLVVAVAAAGASGCNLYSELERPQGDFIDDVGVDASNNVSTDAGEDLGFTDADSTSDERWRAIDVAIGPDATQTVAWRITVPDGIATANFGPGGTWLRVFDEEGNPVARQIESWTTGAHIFWVTVDPEPADTRRFWIRYGVEPDDSGPRDEEVWSAASYTNVWGFASDPTADVPAWIGTKDAVPVEGNGTIAIGGGRVATCVEGLDGWIAAADPQFGVGRTSNGRTYEVIYRSSDDTTGHILSTQDLCNGIGIFTTANNLYGRLHAGTSCVDGFDGDQFMADRPTNDGTAFTHAALTVEPIMQGYQVTVYTNGSRAGGGRLNTMNDIAGNELEIAAYLGNEEHSLCIDQVHITSGLRLEEDMLAAFRGTIGDGVTIGGELRSAEFASIGQ